MSDIDHYHDDGEPNLSVSTFWFDPFRIPQYELLVKDGKISQEDADNYRRMREEAGLPMTFAELQSRPGEGFEWLYEVAGLSVQNRGKVSLDGNMWEGYRVAEYDGELRRHLVCDGDQYQILEIKGNGKGQFRWSATNKIGEGVYARAWGVCDSFDKVLEACRQYSFELMDLHGIQFYANGRDGQDYIAVGPENQELKINRPSEWSPQWSWEQGLAENSVLGKMVRMFTSDGSFKGEAPTMEDAIASASSASLMFKRLAAELVGNTSFADGVAAGRAELKTEIMGLK